MIDGATALKGDTGATRNLQITPKGYTFACLMVIINYLQPSGIITYTNLKVFAIARKQRYRVKPSTSTVEDIPRTRTRTSSVQTDTESTFHTSDTGTVNTVMSESEPPALSNRCSDDSLHDCAGRRSRSSTFDSALPDSDNEIIETSRTTESSENQTLDDSKKEIYPTSSTVNHITFHGQSRRGRKSALTSVSEETYEDILFHTVGSALKISTAPIAIFPKEQGSAVNELPRLQTAKNKYKTNENKDIGDSTTSDTYVKENTLTSEEDSDNDERPNSQNVKA